MTKKTKAYDCVAAKRRAQARIYDQIHDRSPVEQIAFFRREAAAGDLGTWWRQLHESKQARASS